MDAGNRELGHRMAQQNNQWNQNKSENIEHLIDTYNWLLSYSTL